MTVPVFAASGVHPPASVTASWGVADRLRSGWPARMARAALLLVLAAAVAAGLFATGAQASAHASLEAGADLTRLLRGMAVIKGLMASCAVAGVVWRLGSAATLAWAAAYAAACAAMGAGPGLIWGMVHVGAGALLLHGGLLACLIMLWRDPVVATRLAVLVAARRSR